ncbi:related to MIC14-mitochondrial intermembrane space protein, required for normal oxygen consumption [Sporisorium reilianum f. sp. reilianum]|uniref:Related to MIC14-mitochondrial intermembrane space protein, required for normal oxygen consumption n=1 Tax=Sporisorium reilianum f. sp. reilianum TaxID=72559 RepID=A0A2N8UD04_9BASI|nr:related to MIC14-mitochondrial intermembrane space protein, required for normal oxygen consumption [Sporisorium reilianum f. sp. reilianum]
MELSIDQVAAKCGKQLDTFQRCILANQQNPGACEQYKTELSRCAAAAVPLLNEIKNRCAAQVIAYDKCLEQYTSKGDAELEKNCTPKLRDLWFCTEKVKREIESKDNAELQRLKQAGKEALSK